MPALSLARSVLEGKGKNGVALLHRILAVGLARVQGVVDLVKSRRGGELVFFDVSSRSLGWKKDGSGRLEPTRVLNG